MRSQRFQNRVTAGRFTLPAAILISVACWILSAILLPDLEIRKGNYPLWDIFYSSCIPTWGTRLFSFILYSVIGYFLIGLNNAFAIIRMRASVQTAIYFLLISVQVAGLGIAMGHAQDSVKVCADYVTASNEEDGVAQSVEKLILAEVHAAEIPLDLLNERARHALMGNLGIQYTYASEERIEATMPVDHRTRQPFGILHGGATLALAETVAGLGSMITCQPDEIVVGMQVSGNHISSAHEGDTVRAVATIVHKGRSSHVWNVDVFTSTNKLVSSVRVVNSVLKKR